MSGLPSMVHGDGIKKSVQVKFKGYDHNPGAEEGSLWDMENLSGDSAPVLAPRKPRYLLRTLEKPNGLYAGESLCWADGGSFYVDGEQKGAVEDSRKQFCALGDYLILLPDKAYYNKRTGEFGSLEAQWSGGVRFEDGVFAGESAKGNSIVSTGEAFPFSVNEAVTISGCGEERNNKTAVIREVSEDGKTLRFYENSFQVWSGEAVLKREVPDMDFLCENENRLWGCKGSTIYASSLGNPFIWNTFATVSTACFAADVGSAGDFTGCCSYLGYPVFFKEDQIYKVYGSKPSNFQVMGSASLGVEKGSGRSLAVAGERLFYLSRSGVVSYAGGVPQVISQALGQQRFRNAVGGSDGTKYYVSLEDSLGASHLFAFDTRIGQWYREDGVRALEFGWGGELYLLASDGGLWLAGDPRSIPEGAVQETLQSAAEFGDFIEGSPGKKGLSKLLLRAELEAGASLRVLVRYDGGPWRQAGQLQAEKKRSFLLPLIPRRCDHYRIRLEGTGGWRLFSLTREFYLGTEL